MSTDAAPAPRIRVLAVGNLLADGQRSMQRYHAMIAAVGGPGLRMDGLLPPAVCARFSRPGSGIGKWLCHVDKYLVFPPLLALRQFRHDIIHITDNGNALWGLLVPRRKLVVTCHDLICLKVLRGEDDTVRVSRLGRILQRLNNAALARARLVICVSQATRSDFRRLLPDAAGRIEVIANGLDPAFHPTPGPEPDRTDPRPFILHVGSALARKNREAALHTLAIARRERDLRLVLAGGAPTADLLSLAGSLGIGDAVEFVSEPPDAVVAGLYRSALCLLFPSRSEGFGWPLIEAQACGCPVVASDCPPFADILRGTAPMLRPDDHAGMARAILALCDPATRDGARDRGLANAARFSAATMREALARAYSGRTEEG